MKLMSIVVKPSKVEAVKSAISSVGVSGATILDARGFGSTRGTQTLIGSSISSGYKS